MSPYILCKILSFQARVAQEVLNRSFSDSLGQLTVLCPFSIQSRYFYSSTRNSSNYANEANIVNKDSPIWSFSSYCHRTRTNVITTCQSQQTQARPLMSQSELEAKHEAWAKPLFLPTRKSAKMPYVTRTIRERRLNDSRTPPSSHPNLFSS